MNEKRPTGSRLRRGYEREGKRSETSHTVNIPFVSGGPSGRTALGSDDRREEKSAERDMETVPKRQGSGG